MCTCTGIFALCDCGKVLVYVIMLKLKTGIDGRQFRHLIKDPEFENSMNEVELEACMESFCSGREKLSWRQGGQGLRRTRHQYAT